jgi:hypothetical protein
VDDGSLSNEEIADYILDLLEEFSPAVTVKDGEEGDWVEVGIIMNRTRRDVPAEPIRGHGPDPFNE